MSLALLNSSRRSLAMWTLSSCGALQNVTPPDCSARVRDSGALELLKEAAGLLKDLNGEDDKSLGWFWNVLD
eukprot:s632_g19.t1